MRPGVSETPEAPVTLNVKVREFASLRLVRRKPLEVSMRGRLFSVEPPRNAPGDEYRLPHPILLVNRFLVFFGRPPEQVAQELELIHSDL